MPKKEALAKRRSVRRMERTRGTELHPRPYACPGGETAENEPVELEEALRKGAQSRGKPKDSHRPNYYRATASIQPFICHLGSAAVQPTPSLEAVLG